MARVNVVSRSDIARCPAHRLDAAHYRDDGSCRCEQRPEVVAKIEELRAERRRLLIEICRLQEQL